MSKPIKLSPNFSSKEFECPCCGQAQMSAGLILALEELRALVSKELGKSTPLKVSSGYRCPAKNKSEGGAQSSLHLTGKAVDIYCPKGLRLEEFYALAAKVPKFTSGGIGAYPKGFGQNNDFLHLDDRGTRARWSRLDGKYLAIEAAFKQGVA